MSQKKRLYNLYLNLPWVITWLGGFSNWIILTIYLLNLLILQVWTLIIIWAAKKTACYVGHFGGSRNGIETFYSLWHQSHQIHKYCIYSVLPNKNQTIKSINAFCFIELSVFFETCLLSNERGHLGRTNYSPKSPMIISNKYHWQKSVRLFSNSKNSEPSKKIKIGLDTTFPVTGIFTCICSRFLR